MSSAIRRKGRGDEYVVQAFMNWISSLGYEKAEIKCDQEPAAVDLRDELVRRCKGTQLVPRASPKGSKGALGRAERAHLGIQGQLRTYRLALQSSYGHDFGPNNLLMQWAPRHIAWIQQRFQTRSSGKTAYWNQRRQEYRGGLAIYGECVMYKVITEDKLDDRWRRGVFVGKVDQTDEFVMVTPDGVKKSRSIRREIKPHKFDPQIPRDLQRTTLGPSRASGGHHQCDEEVRPLGSRRASKANVHHSGDDPQTWGYRWVPEVREIRRRAQRRMQIEV